MFETRSVEPGSPAQRAGILPGDFIASINGEELIDYIDYVYFSSLKKLKLKVIRQGAAFTLRINKREDEPLGLEFAQPLLGKKRVCGNKCVFCFVDQLPKCMRRTLYVKDEDWRYSLVMGNYVTLSTISEEEVSRIIRRKASPLYISVHTVDEDLRRSMLGRPGAVPIRPLLRRLASHGISFHAQIVVCPGYNDGDKLEESYEFLRCLHPAAVSLAIVPVGLTSFREGLAHIDPVSKEGAQEIIKRVEKWQKECLNKCSTRFVFAADELYIKAGADLPPAEDYESFPQIENGVGMISKFLSEAKEALAGRRAERRVSIATGEDAYAFIKGLAGSIEGETPFIYSVKNLTFKGGVTVTGLLSGRDYLAALSGRDLGEALLISADSLREGVFLDDMALCELEQVLGVKIFPAADGYEFAELITEEITEGR